MSSQRSNFFDLITSDPTVSVVVAYSLDRALNKTDLGKLEKISESQNGNHIQLDVKSGAFTVRTGFKTIIELLEANRIDHIGFFFVVAEIENRINKLETFKEIEWRSNKRFEAAERNVLVYGDA